MRARDLDLGTLWQDVCYRHEQQGCRVPPWRWRLFHRLALEVLAWGATGIGPQGIRAAARRLLAAAREVRA